MKKFVLKPTSPSTTTIGEAYENAYLKAANGHSVFKAEMLKKREARRENKRNFYKSIARKRRAARKELFAKLNNKKNRAEREAKKEAARAEARELFAKNDRTPEEAIRLVTKNFNLKWGKKYKTYKILRSIAKGESFKTVEVNSPRCDASDKGAKIFLMDWKSLGFKFCPSKIKLGNDEYISIGATNGGAKKGTVLMAESDWLESHPEFKVDYLEYESAESEVAAAESAKMYDEASEKALQSMHHKKDSPEHYKLVVESENIKDKRDAVKSKVHAHLKNEKMPVNKANQAVGLSFTPSWPIGEKIKLGDIAIVDDIVKTVKNDSGKAIEPETFAIIDQETVDLKTTDGLLICSFSKAKELHIKIRKPIVFPIRDSKDHDRASMKGLMVFVPDKTYKALMPSTTDMFGDPIPENAIIAFKSTVKDADTYYHMKDFIDKGIRLRRCETDDNFSGRIWLARQTFEAVMWRATIDEITAVAKPMIDAFNAFKTAEGYKLLCNNISDITRMPEFEELVNSKMFERIVAKQVWNMFHKACAGRIVTQGHMTYCTPDIGRVLSMLAKCELKTAQQEVIDKCIAESKPLPEEYAIPAMHIKVSRKTGLKIGQKVVLCRYPHINCEPVVATIIGYTDLPVIELSMDDSIMLKLDADFDGDHLVCISQPEIVSAAERAVAFLKKCDIGTFAFKDVSASNEAKTSELVDYLTRCANMGNVGAATTPIFVLYAMINRIAKPDDTIELGGVSYSMRQILGYIAKEKVNVTLEADSGKRNAEPAFGRTEDGEIVRTLNAEFCAMSEYYSHPNEVVVYDSGYYQKKDEKKKWTEAKRPVGREAKSAMAKLHSVIHKGVGVDLDVIYREYIDILNGYKHFSDDHEVEITGGFVYTPDTSKYHGISKDIWWIDTGLDFVDAKRSKVIVNFANFKGEDMIFVGEGKYIKAKDFREFVKNGLDEKEEGVEMSDAEWESALDLRPGSLTVGLLSHRLRSTLMSMNRHMSDGPKDRKEVRLDSLKHMRHIIMAVIYRNRKIEITEDQARRILYNEEARFLFGTYSNESSSADLQFFLDEYRKELDEAVSKYRGKSATVLSEVNDPDAKADEEIAASED